MSYGYAHEALQLERRLLPSRGAVRQLDDAINRRLGPQGLLGGAWVPIPGSTGGGGGIAGRFGGWLGSRGVDTEMPTRGPDPDFRLFGGQGHRLGD